MVTPDNDTHIALLLSGQSHHFSKTRARIMKEYSSVFKNVDILSATWSDRFGTIDTRFNNDVDYLRSIIVPEQIHSKYAQLNSTGCVLVSNHELLDEYERMQRKFDEELNVMQFIQYFVVPFLTCKTLKLFKDHSHKHNITYDYVCRSRFDLLVQEDTFPMVKEEFEKKEFKKIYSKNVEETHADQDSYFSNHKTFEYLARTYLVEHRSSVETFFRNNILIDKDLSRSSILFPESLFLQAMTNLGITIEKRYPYKYTGIYRNHVDDYGSVNDIRRRNLMEQGYLKWI